VIINSFAVRTTPVLIGSAKVKVFVIPPKLFLKKFRFFYPGICFIVEELNPFFKDGLQRYGSHTYQPIFLIGFIHIRCTVPFTFSSILLSENYPFVERAAKIGRESFLPNLF